MEETRDVVVVGGGIAGLTAAWRLRDRDVLLLEAGDRVGGRLRSDARADRWLNFGAHLFPAPGSLVDGLAIELGLEAVPVTGSMMGLALGSTILDRGRVETYPLRLSLSLRERVAFARAGVRMQRAVARYHAIAQPRSGEAVEDVRARVLAFEDGRTYREFLGPLPPVVESIFSCAAHRATAELDELSAGCGIGLFALVWSGAGSLTARNLLGGTGRLPAALGEALGERVRTGARVTAIVPDGDAQLVTYGTDRIRARHVIVAAQAPHAAPLVEPTAPGAAAALAQLTYGTFLSVAVETGPGPAPWDGVYAIATPGRVFDMFTNQGAAGGGLMLFAGGHGAEALATEPDAIIVRRFLADLDGLYPGARAVVRDAVVHRWPLGNVFARPGRGALQWPLEGALGEHHNLHLAGDYFAELGSMEAAARTGDVAARRVERRIQQGALYV